MRGIHKGYPYLGEGRDLQQCAQKWTDRGRGLFVSGHLINSNCTVVQIREQLIQCGAEGSGRG